MYVIIKNVFRLAILKYLFSLSIALESRITFLKSAKGPISISECHAEGHYVIIDNTSRSKNIDLTNWIIRQEKDHEDKIIFTFPTNCLLKPNHSLKVIKFIIEFFHMDKFILLDLVKKK